MNVNDYIINNRLKIIVRPNSSENKIIGYDESRKAIKVNIAAKPEENKANMEVIKFFSRLLKKRVKIKSGFISKEKLLLLK
ncbi:TPA: YggU family protein [Candidatus Woesearchaeota archaeon]|nr:YggU family protein [Candidatus Woesearchaeota archaeon]